jgi:hypothetical protein
MTPRPVSNAFFAIRVDRPGGGISLPDYYKPFGARDLAAIVLPVFIGLGNHTHGPQTAIRGDRLIRGLPVRQRLEIHGLMAADRCIEATLGYAPLKWHPLPASD